LIPHKPIPLLPYEQALARRLGVSEETYQRFRAEAVSRTRIDPAQPTAGAFALTFAINLVLGVGFTLLGSLLKPKPPGKAPTINLQSKEGTTINQNQRAAPRFGFGSTQDIATSGQPYPLVVAKRVRLPEPDTTEITYGGVRSNMLLLWSQLWSIGGSQLFRGIFLIGRGPMGELPPQAFAFGDNTLVGYDLGADSDNDASRYTLYYKPNGERIVGTDRLAGRSAEKDPANMENRGGSDVFTYVGRDGLIQQGFCCTAKPVSSTVFGVHAPMSNGLAYRVAPRMRPTCSAAIYSQDGDYYLECEDDTGALCDFWKSKYSWSSRSGFIKYIRDGDTEYPAGGEEQVLEDVEVGDLVTYKMGRETDAESSIFFNSVNSDINEEDDAATEIFCGDVGSAVAGWQRTADSNLMIGEVYKCGSALLVLETRSEFFFSSDADNEPVGGGRDMYCEFRVIRAGKMGFVGDLVINPSTTGSQRVPPQYDRDTDMADIDGGERYKTCTGFPQLYRCSLAAFAVTRETRLIEIGLKSTVGIRVNGITNFRDCLTLKEVNGAAGQNRTGPASDDTKINASSFTSGTISKTQETRYSGFILQFQLPSDPENWWEFRDCAFLVKSSTNEPIYSYLRVQFPFLSLNWRVRLEPLSSWQVVTGAGWSGTFIVLDVNSNRGSRENADQGIRVSYNGYELERDNQEIAFSLATLDATEDLGYGFTEGESMFDTYGRVAEKFCYDEITTTAQDGPEHEIVYVNIITPNKEVATYRRLALVGVNVMAGNELQQLSQASVGVENGYMMRALRNANTVESTNLFPDLLRELLTSVELGEGYAVSDIQINEPRFIAAANWCYDRRYFFDGVIPGPLNLLSWIQSVSGSHLLNFSKRGSKFRLDPALVFNAPVPISGLFTAGNIVKDSFELALVPFEDRQPFRAIGTYRVEGPNLSLTEHGWFPTEKTIQIREADSLAQIPMREFDLSDYCTSRRHLIDAMCYAIRLQRLVDHTISFRTTPDGITAALGTGDYIKVSYDLLSFDRFAHGVITNDGVLVTTQPDNMLPGSYLALTWDGSETDPIEQTITVNLDGTASPEGIMFAVKDIAYQSRVYTITKLSMDREGYVDIVASAHPCDENGYSLLAKDWTTYVTDENWIIRE
jgi:hypothetical protein